MAGRNKMPLSVIIGGGKTHLTKAQIEERAQAEASLRPATDKVKCPSWLDGIAKREWHSVVADLREKDMISNLDVTSLAMFCDAVSKYRAASDLVRKEGTVITFKNALGATNRVAHPAVGVMKTMAAIAKAYGSEFGLSFGARLRLTPPKKGEPKETELEEQGFGEV